jgi:hypothetical protein
VAGLGLFTAESLKWDLYLAPVTVIGALVGLYIFRKMDQRIFVGTALGLSGLASVWLIIHG